MERVVKMFWSALAICLVCFTIGWFIISVVIGASIPEGYDD